MVHNWQGTGLSATQVLMDANEQNIKIYTIDNDNASRILPQLQLPEAALSDINSAIKVGYAVITPERVPDKAVGARGAGYIIMDPVTGEGSYRISGGLDGGQGQAPCAEPQRMPLSQSISNIIMTALFLAALAILLAGITAGTGGVGGAAIPAVARLMASYGLSFLTFPATAGEFCTPVPLGYHRGGDPFHDKCADIYPPNEFLGSDACLSDGTNERSFDAITGNILWEAKTDNLDNWEPSKRAVFAKISVLGKWEKTASYESPIARSCRFQYRFIVGDAELASAALAKPSLSSLVDKFEIDAPLCLKPWTGEYPQR